MLAQFDETKRLIGRIPKSMGCCRAFVMPAWNTRQRLAYEAGKVHMHRRNLWFLQIENIRTPFFAGAAFAFHATRESCSDVL